MATADDLLGAPTTDEVLGPEEKPQLLVPGSSTPEVPPDPNAPLPPSKGLLDRLYEGASRFAHFDQVGAFIKGLPEGFGSEPVGMSSETGQKFRDLGIFNDPAKGQSSPIRFLDEAIARPAATAVDTLFRAVKAGVYGVGNVVGGAVKAISGDETKGEQAKREAINLQNFLMLTAPGLNPMTRVERAPAGSVHDAQIGGLPTLADFDNAATVLKSDAAKPVLRQLYDEHGVSPSEVIHDAQGDVTILQDLSAGKVPESYGGPKVEPVTAADVEAAPTADEKIAKLAQLEDQRAVSGDTSVPSGGKPTPAVQEGAGGGSGEPPKPPGELPNDRGGQKALPAPGEPMTTREAQDAMLERISVGERDTGRKTTFQTLYTAFIDDLNPVHEAVKQALEDIHPSRLGEVTSAVNPYELFRLTRGLAGKADQMIKHGTYSALSLKTNGIGLEEVLKPLQEKAPAGELDLMSQFRAYTTAKRTVELADRGVETGMPLEAAKQIVSDPAQVARMEPIHRAAVDYQNRLSMYLRDAGLLSPKAYEAMMEANKNYTPFYRYIGDVALPNGGTGRTLSSRNPIQKITGSDARIIDPIESMVKNTYTYIALAEKNMAGRALVDLLQTADKGGLYRVDLLPNEPKAPAAASKSGPALAAPDKPPLEGPRPGLIEGEVIPPTSVPELDWSKLPAKPKAEGDLIKSAKGAEGPKIIDADFSEIPEEGDLRATIETLARTPEGEAITVYRDGKKETYRVSDPELLAAWRGLDTQTVGWFTKIMATPARTLRAGATLIPEFAVGNLIRDFQTAFVNTKGGLFSPLQTARGALELIRKGEDYQSWLKGGGANAALVSIDRRYLQEGLTNLGKETGLGERAWNLVKSPLQGLRFISELTENATRLGEFKKAMREAGPDAGKADIQAAAFRSREATLDFARMGSQTRAYNMITAFANANIQGTDRLIRAFHDAPLSTSLRIAAGVTAPSLVLWAFNRSDPVYQQLPDWQKDLFYIFPVHSWSDSTQAEADRRALPDHLRRTTSDGKFQIDDPTVFRVKKDFTTGLLFGSGAERAAEQFFNQNPKAWDHFFGSVVSSLAPGVIPTGAVPMAEQVANKSFFTGGPLIPQRQEKELPEYQYGPNTSELSRAIGRVVGAFPGMRDAANDASHPMNGMASALTSPVLIENYIRDWTGGLGQDVLLATDYAARKAGVVEDPTRPTATLADIPFIRSFIVRYPSAQAQAIQDFYDRNAVNQKVSATLQERAKAGDTDAVEKIKTLDMGKIITADGMAKAMSAQEKVIRNIYAIGESDAAKAKNAPNYKPALTPLEMRQHIDAIYYQLIQSAKGGNQLLDAVEAAAKKH